MYKSVCASTGNYLFEIQMLLQHTNENVNTNHHSARIIIHHESLIVQSNFALTEKSGLQTSLLRHDSISTPLKRQEKRTQHSPICSPNPSYLQSSLSISKCGLKLRTMRCEGSGAVMTQWQFWWGGYSRG